MKYANLGSLTPYSFYKERVYVGGILIGSISPYKHQASSSSRYIEFPSSHTFIVIGDYIVTNLIFGGSLVIAIYLLYGNLSKLGKIYIIKKRKTYKCSIQAIEIIHGIFSKKERKK